MRFYSLKWTFLIAALFLFAACSEDEGEEMVETRTITSLKYVLGTSGGNPSVELSWSDPDGEGGADPVIEGGTLVANAIYFGDLKLFNESVSPVENTNDLINAAREDHQFFFLTSGIDLNIMYADVDGNSNPIGLFTALTTGGPGSGTLTISLQRNLNKFGAGVSDGQLINAGGITDIQVSFPITIQ